MSERPKRSRQPPDPNWRKASAIIRSAAKLSGWAVKYYGTARSGAQAWIMLQPPTPNRNSGAVTIAYRRGDDFMRRGPYYSLLTRYDQQERMPLP